MRNHLAFAGLICLGAAVAIAADKPTPAMLPVERLIEQLGSRNYREREAASKALEARGESALEPMRKAIVTTKDPEARRRLQVLVGNLERAAILAPKRLTVKVQNQPISSVIDSIAKQTGYLIQFQGGNRNHPVSLDFQNRPFWEVMDRICLEGGLMLQYNEPASMYLYQNETIWPHVCYQGPFKMTANNFYYSRNLALGGLPRNPAQQQTRQESLQFSFNIQSELKLPMMQLHQPKVAEAVDDRGRSLMYPVNNQESVHYYNGGYRTHNYSSQVQLMPASKDARFVKRLRGMVPLTLLAAQKPDVVINDILKVKKKKFTGVEAEIQIEEVKEANNKTQYSVRMTVRNQAKNANQDYNWNSYVQQRFELTDAKGNKYYSHGHNWEHSSTGSITATFMFGTNGQAGIGPPARLVYNQWIMMPHQIEFDFRDLPLP